MHADNPSTSRLGTISFFSSWRVLLAASLLDTFSESNGAPIQITHIQLKNIAASDLFVACEFVLSVVVGCIKLYQHKTKEAWKSLGFGIIIAMSVLASAMHQGIAK